MQLTLLEMIASLLKHTFLTVFSVISCHTEESVGRKFKLRLWERTTHTDGGIDNISGQQEKPLTV